MEKTLNRVFLCGADAKIGVKYLIDSECIWPNDGDCKTCKGGRRRVCECVCGGPRPTLTLSKGTSSDLFISESANTWGVYFVDKVINWVSLNTQRFVGQ